MISTTRSRPKCLAGGDSLERRPRLCDSVACDEHCGCRLSASTKVECCSGRPLPAGTVWAHAARTASGLRTCLHGCVEPGRGIAALAFGPAAVQDRSRRPARRLRAVSRIGTPTITSHALASTPSRVPSPAPSARTIRPLAMTQDGFLFEYQRIARVHSSGIWPKGGRPLAAACPCRPPCWTPMDRKRQARTTSPLQAGRLQQPTPEMQQIPPLMREQFEPCVDQCRLTSYPP